MPRIAVIGNLCLDVIGDDEPRVGGPVYYGARALAALGADASVGAACAASDRELLLPQIEQLGLAVTWYPSAETTRYAFTYDGDRRLMLQKAFADPWSAEVAVEAVGDATWVHVGALTRGEFPATTLAALAAGGRKLLLDAQGLVRPRRQGPLVLDGSRQGELPHVTILKVNEEEAEALTGTTDPEALRGLGVPEVALTLGARGAVLVTRTDTVSVPAPRVDADVDPTGAGDTFSAAYLHARSSGVDPMEACRLAVVFATAHVASS